MRELLLLRHAEAAPAAGATDHERVLSPHGEQQARAVGDWLAAQGLRPDRVLASSARRARRTAELALAAFTPAPQIVALDAIYDATPGELLALLERHADSPRVLLVGHNPTIAQLVRVLCPQVSPGRGMAPATLARIAVDGAAEPGAGRLLTLRDT